MRLERRSRGGNILTGASLNRSSKSRSRNPGLSPGDNGLELRSASGKPNRNDALAVRSGPSAMFHVKHGPMVLEYRC